MRYKDQIQHKINSVSNLVKTMRYNAERGFIKEVRINEESIQGILEDLNTLIEVQDNQY